MEDIYWSWYAVALWLEVLFLLIGIQESHSIRAKNFQKIWLFYSYSQGRFIEDEPSKILQTIGLLFNFIINPLLSWVTVTMKAYGLFKYVNERLSTPENVKEIQFKLKSSVMQKEEVMDLFRKLAELRGTKLILEDDEDDEDSNLLILNDTDGWYCDVRIYKDEGQLAFYQHTPDYDSEWDDLYEYKIEDSDVLMKLIQRKTTHPGEQYFEVRDWVILESEIIDRVSIGSDMQIKELRSKIEWTICNNHSVRFFVLSKHPEILTEREFRTFLRSELERLWRWMRTAKEIGAKHWMSLVSDDGYVDFKPNSQESDDNFSVFLDELNSELSKIECQFDEIRNREKIAQTIEGYLAESN